MTVPQSQCILFNYVVQVDQQVTITDHAVEENHVIDWDKAKVVDREAQWIKKSTLDQEDTDVHELGCRILSTAAGQLLVPRTNTNIGRRGFHCCGPATWNALPVSLRTDNRAFGRALKRHLFSI